MPISRFFFLPKVPVLVCSVAVYLTVESPVSRAYGMSEQSTAQFCFSLMSQPCAWGWPHNKQWETLHHYSITYMPPCSCGAADKFRHHLSLKRDVYCSITSPKHGLIEVKTLSRSDLICLDSTHCRPLLVAGMQLAIVEVSAVAPYVVFCMFYVVCFGDSLQWGSWDKSG